MADRYWVGGTASWDATAGTKWALTSGGAGGQAAPTAADDVYLDAASGVVTVSATAVVCRSINCTGFTGTLTIGSSITIGTSTPGAGNIAAKLVAGMTLSPGSGTWSFASTSATQQTITTGGKSFAAVNINGTGGSWLLADSFTASGIVTHSIGTLDTGSQTVNCLTFTISGAGTKVLTLGSSTLTAATFSPNVSGLTITANTATISTGLFSMGSSGSINLNGGSIFLQAGPSSQIGATTTGKTLTCKDVTYTGTAVKSNTFKIFGVDIVCTGTFAVNGNAAVNRVLLCGSDLSGSFFTSGSVRTITAAVVSMSNVDLRDIVGAGAGSWNLSAISGGSGDCGGCTGVTFTTPTTQTATGSASFTWSTHAWTTRVPLPQDTAVIPNAFIAGRTITADMLRYGTIDCTGSTGNVVLSFGGLTSVEFYGHVTLRAGMSTVSQPTSAWSWYGAAQQNLTSNGVQWGSISRSWTIPRSKLQLQDDHTIVATITVSVAGNLDTQSFALTCTAISNNSATSNTSLFGTSTVTVTNTTQTNIVNLLAARTSAASATFVIGTAESTNTRTVALGAASIGALTYSVASSSGALLISGGGTIGTLTIGPARTLTITNGTTVTIGSAFIADGVVSTGGGLVLNGVAGNYASAPDSTALSIVGDITLVAQLSMLDWTPTASSNVMTKWSTGSTQSYNFWVQASGALGFAWSANGTNVATAGSTVVNTFVNGSTNWIAVSFDVDNGAGGSSCRFWTSPDGVTWTQLGATVTGVGVAALFDSTSVLELGSQTLGTINLLAGELKICRIYSGMGFTSAGPSGVLAFDADLTSKAWGADTFVESSSNAATVTINGANALSSDGAVRIRSTTPGSAATLSKASGVVNISDASLRDSTATGGATFNAVDSLSVSNVTGWNFVSGWVPQAVCIF
jgi:hypothetical protein